MNTLEKKFLVMADAVNGIFRVSSLDDYDGCKVLEENDFYESLRELQEGCIGAVISQDMADKIESEYKIRNRPSQQSNRRIKMYEKIYAKNGNLKHSPECRNALGRKDPKCPRCLELFVRGRTTARKLPRRVGGKK
jgi:hypothetical protein